MGFLGVPGLHTLGPTSTQTTRAFTNYIWRYGALTADCLLKHLKITVMYAG